MRLTKVVDFSTAKLLKEKGFDNVCYSYYENERLYKGPFGTTIINSEYGSRPSVKEILNSDFELKCYKIRKKEYVAAPTIAEVVMWLYEKHGIWVEVIETDLFNKFFFQIKRKDNTRLKNGDFNSPTEAYENVIEYVLNNLI
jgi:hypothetical protein